MKRSRIVALDARLLVLAGGTAVIVGACGDRERSASDTTTGDTAGLAAVAPACRISSDSVRRLTRRQFVTWASGLGYNSHNPDSGRAWGFDSAAEVRIERARGIGNAARRDIEDGCVIARVFSRRPYPRVGLDSGWTYIWADSSSPYSASFVPEASDAPVVGQRMALDTMAPLTVAGTPRHVCSGCGRDWCVYPTDTIGTAPVEFLPEP